MPLISDLGNTTDIIRLSYNSDAIFYDYTCQWLAPEPNPPDEFDLGWNFGGMTGNFDSTRATVADNNSPQGLNGGYGFGEPGYVKKKEY